MKLFQSIFIGFIAFQAFNAAAVIKPRQAKNLFLIVDPARKHCSPFEGMVWWESNAIENIYRIGDPESATTKLVKLLFHLHPDGVFDCTRPQRVTRNNGNAAAYLTPEIIAEFIEILERLNTVKEIDDYKKTIDNAYINQFLDQHKNIFPSDGNYHKNLKKTLRLIRVLT